MNRSRRRLIATTIGALLGSRVAPALCGDLAALVAGDETRRNFRTIYGDPRAREEFRNFLVNVFHLYPEDELHALIARLAIEKPDDRAVYEAGQAELGGISPMLRDIRYSLPALAKQKRVLADQTVGLLGVPERVEGFLEIGTTGRFLDSLEEVLSIEGGIYTIADPAPTYSPVDMVDRGQLFKAGEHHSLGNYESSIFRPIPRGSLDLVTVYIGFHHCPVDYRGDFFAGIRELMRPGGAMVVRDHEVNSPLMWHMVALAHDVFNMGTAATWTANENERRNFYSLAELDRMLLAAGFRGDGRRLLQDGDPTHNTLMLYRKA